MSKALKHLLAAALAVMLCAWAAAAQAPSTQSPTDKADTWVVVSPAGEGFGVLMSKQPTSSEQRVQAGGLPVSVRRYAAADEQTTFIVWALKDPQEVERPGANQPALDIGGVSLYLDRIAELAWELIVNPEVERLKRAGDDGRRVAAAMLGMSYKRQFKLSEHTAREYSVRLEKEHGLVYVCADGGRIYIVAGLSAAAVEPRLKLFADSFTLGGKPRLPSAMPAAASAQNPTLPVPSTIQVDPLLIKPESRDTSSGPGRGGNTGGGDHLEGGGDPGASGDSIDYTRPFKQSEVTRKAIITFKVEPGFTEWARRFNVTGVVRLRAILHNTGTVQSISVIKSLPHGLTEKSIAAARQIHFEPAQKDGHPVSQYVVLEYNFNIY